MSRLSIEMTLPLYFNSMPASGPRVWCRADARADGKMDAGRLCPVFHVTDAELPNHDCVFRVPVESHVPGIQLPG